MDADEIVRAIVGASYEVSNVLGAGFLEKVYQTALLQELTDRRLAVESQVRYGIDYKGHCVGEYVADLLVEATVIVELKRVDHLANEHLAQCLNYLIASGHHLALLLTFQKPKVEWKRIIL